MSFLEDIATQLNTASVGVYPGTSATRTIYIGEMPDAPDALICLYPRAGRRRVCHTGGDILRPDLHIEVRAATYAAALAKLAAIDAALHRFGNATVGGTAFILVKAASEMTTLGKDARNRSILSQNFEIDIDT